MLKFVSLKFDLFNKFTSKKFDFVYIEKDINIYKL